MTAVADRQAENRWIVITMILLTITLGAGAVIKKSGATSIACYDTGESQVVAVVDSGIQSSLRYQHEVQCSNGESYWR